MNINLLELLARMGRINPAIFDVIPRGPQRVWSFAEVSGSEKVELNPQPIPPGHELQFATARAAHEIGIAAIAAEAAGSDEGAARIISDAVDDWCGTGTGRIPIPWPRHWPVPPSPDPDPHPWDVASIRAIAGLTLASLASRMTEGEAREALAHGAEQLLDAAVSEQTEFAAV